MERINTLGQDHQNALTSAVLSEDIDSVRFLLKNGATVSEEAVLFSPLARDPALLELLLSATHVDMKSPLAMRLLTRAARNSASTRLLLEKGADVNTPDPNSGETPLMAAIFAGSLDSAVLLVSKGADVNATDKSGRTPLWFAATQSNSGFITLLTQHGAKINAQGPAGQTPLIQASLFCFYWNIEPLLAAGADPGITDQEGRTAAQYLVPADDQKCKRSRELFESAAHRRIAGRAITGQR